MKSFNLEEAKAGKPICTRNGDKARIIATDIKSDFCPIAVAITDPICGTEQVKVYTKDGTILIGEGNSLDLFMVDEEPKCPFKPFDKVLARDSDTSWCRIDFFERYAPEYDRCHFIGFKFAYAQCIPYNEETEHLIGTTDAPPEKYVIW